MKKIIGSLIILMMFICNCTCAYADEHEYEVLPVDICSYDGEKIMVRDGSPLYSAVPVTFTPDAAGDECYYCVRAEGEDSFGEYMKMEHEYLTLYPDDEKDPLKRMDIKFRSIRCAEEDEQNEQNEGADHTEGGSVRESRIYSLVFDVTAPIVEAADPEELSGWKKEGDTIGFDVSDDISGIGRIIMKCNDKVIRQFDHTSVPTVNDIEEKGRVYYPVTDTGACENHAVIECFDQAGNESAVSFEYKMDTDIPDVSIEGTEDGACHAGAVNLRILASDKDSDVFVSYSIERQYGEEVQTSEVSNIAEKEEITIDNDGEYTVRARAVDSSGNSSEERSVSFVIDTEAPDIYIEGVEDNVDQRSAADMMIDISENVHSSAEVDINLTRSAMGKTEVIRNEQYEMEGSHEIRKVNISSDGEYELSVCARDAAGNSSNIVKKFRIDKTPPDISVSGINEGEVTCEKPVLRFGAGEMFYDTTVLSAILEKKGKDGYVPVKSMDRVMTSSVDHMDVETPGEGRYRLTCIAADRSGNTSSSTVSFTVDYTPPVIADLSDVDNKFFKAFMLPAKVSSLVKDTTKVSADAYVNDKKIDDEDTIIEEGKYVLSILAEDEAGNAADNEATFIVDHTAPQVVLTGCDRDGNIKKGDLLTVSLLEEGDTLKSVKYNGRNIVIENGNKADIVVDDYGEHTIAVIAEDEAGNVADTEIHTSCYMLGKTIDDYLMGGKTITVSAGGKDEGDVDMAGLIVGLASVVGGTLGLSCRELFRQ